jgi:hypothetical protein
MPLTASTRWKGRRGGRPLWRTRPSIGFYHNSTHCAWKGAGRAMAIWWHGTLYMTYPSSRGVRKGYDLGTFLFCLAIVSIYDRLREDFVPEGSLYMLRHCVLRRRAPHGTSRQSGPRTRSRDRHVRQFGIAHWMKAHDVRAWPLGRLRPGQPGHPARRWWIPTYPTWYKGSRHASGFQGTAPCAQTFSHAHWRILVGTAKISSAL